MRTFFAAATGLLSVSLIACSTSPDGGEAGDGDDALPPLAKAFEGTTLPAALATGPDGDMFFAGTFASDVDFGGGTLTAETNGSLFVAHLDAGGEHLWSGSTGSDDDKPLDVAIGPSGDQYVVGSFDDQINFGSGKLAGRYDAFFAAFTEGGAPDHSFSAGVEKSGERFMSVATTPAGIVVVAGEVGDEVDLGAGLPPPGTSITGARTVLAAYDREGDLLWETRFLDDFVKRFQIAADPVGNLFLAGDSNGAYVSDDLVVPPGLFVMKLTPSGEPLWVRGSDGAPGVARFHDMGVDGAGNVAITGIYFDAFTFSDVQVPPVTGEFGGYVARLNGDGEVEHVKTFGVDGYDTTMSLGVSKSGDSVLAVSTYYPVDFGTGPKGSPGIDNWAVVMARWDSSGTLIEAEDLPGTGDERVFDVAMVGGSPVLLGTFNDTLTIGDETLASTSGNSLFIARLAR